MDYFFKSFKSYNLNMKKMSVRKEHFANNVNIVSKL